MVLSKFERLESAVEWSVELKAQFKTATRHDGRDGLVVFLGTIISDVHDYVPFLCSVRKLQLSCRETGIDVVRSYRIYFLLFLWRT